MHESLMRKALTLAQIAYDEGEVPVGALVVSADGVILGEGRNKRETLQSPLAHAEIEAIAQACEALKSWRLLGCSLYVTLEPCLMCTGAALQARIQTLVYGCNDPKAGAVRSLYRAAEDTRLNHRIEVIDGILADESAMMLKSFFQMLRRR